MAPSSASGDASSQENKTRLCPSSRAEEGAMLIGVVSPNGQVGIMGRPLPVDADFLAAARAGVHQKNDSGFRRPASNRVAVNGPKGVAVSSTKLWQTYRHLPPIHGFKLVEFEVPDVGFRKAGQERVQ